MRLMRQSAPFRRLMRWRQTDSKSVSHLVRPELGRAPDDGTIRFLESHGDYRSESSVVEDPSLPLYAQQSSLPRLPVPTPEETVETFLPTALPFARNAQEIRELEEACDRFPHQAAALQERLKLRQKEFHDSSWLQLWWNQLQYLRYRESLLHVSYFYRLEDDPSCRGDGLSRAAAALQAASVYAQQVLSGQRPPDVVQTSGFGNDQPAYFCSTQFKYLFHACRIPQPHQDSFRMFEPTALPHAVVACRGHFYKIPLANPHDHRWLPVETLRALLSDCVRQSSHPWPRVPQLGWLPALDRDSWATAYHALLLPHGALQAALQDLQSSLCVLALDWDDHDDDEGVDVRSGEDDGETPTDTMLRLWHGNLRHSSNRWYDKSFQLVVNRRGQLGYIGEHSMADGMPAMTLCNYLMDKGRVDHGNHPEASKEMVPVVSYLDPPSVSFASSLRAIPLFQHAFELLEESSRQDIHESVERAKQQVVERIRQHELSVLTYGAYGSTFLKQAGVSPDAWVQLAIQLAGRDVFGDVVGTYEATQTRRFLHGRTETTRSVNPESQAFVQLMRNVNSTLQEKRAALGRAVEAHTCYIRKASQGLGVDRHLWGLQLLLREGERVPDLFTDPLFRASKTWKLSTSTVPRARTGFANVEPDGLGIGYDVQAHECIFTLTGRTEHALVQPMEASLRRALDDMRGLLGERVRQPSLPSTLQSRSRL